MYNHSIAQAPLPKLFRGNKEADVERRLMRRKPFSFRCTSFNQKICFIDNSARSSHLHASAENNHIFMDAGCPVLF